MNKNIIKLISCVLLTFAASNGRSADSTPDNASPTQVIALKAEQVSEQIAASGRADPFASSFAETVQEIKPETATIVQTAPEKPQLFIQTITLKLLNAANLKGTLDKMCSEYGKIGVDDNTNTLIICDTKENIENIMAELKKADRSPPQIVIEVIIIDVLLQNDTEIGVDWDALSNDKDVLYRQSLIFPDRLSVVPPTAANIDSATAFQAIGLGTELAIIKNDIRFVVHALQQQRNVNILASPRVMVVSGQKATIETVEEIPYQELTQTPSGGGGSSAMTSTQFKKVGVTMEVKAVVTDDGKIMLGITPEQSINTGMSNGGVPIIDTRKASTTLLMDDGQVVVLGGLRRQDKQVIRKKVPILGDLPLIGLLFSSNQNVVENSELLVMLSPHIYKGEPVPAEGMARFNQMKDNTLITMPKEDKSKKSKNK